MWEFIKDHSLILAIVGTIISFLMFFTEKVASQKKTKLVVVLAALGFLTLTGQQVINHLTLENERIFREKSISIMDHISSTVTKTKTIVEHLSQELKGESPGNIGVELVQS